MIHLNGKNKIAIMFRTCWIMIVVITLSLISPGCDKLSEDAFFSPETVHGVVKDYSHIDGCGLVIELDDGTVIVPYQLDTSMLLAEGQEVEISYAELPVTDYSCGAGVVADINWLEQTGASPIIFERANYDVASLSNTLPSDPFKIEGAKIDGDHLKISLSYGGGCAVHEFIMTYQDLPKTSGYSGILTLGHNSHGDRCEALITRTISFDLKPLQIPEKDMIRLVLVKAGDKDEYKLIIDYYYKK
jgi:hypothetical protein